jgi:uncharacterized tellurite resistance protein B-like protein
MTDNNKILQGNSDPEKGAYLGAIASIATADRQASEEEMDYIAELCEAADLSSQQKQAVLRATTELSSDELTRCLDILKESDLRFSLITDLMAFAKADENYNEAEQENVRKIAAYIDVNEQQFSLLDQFAEKTKTAQLPSSENNNQHFLSSLGMKEKLKSAGINGNSLLKGLIGFAAPMILSGLLSSRSGRGRSSAFNSNTGMGGGGGLGSIIGMLNGGRGFGSTGGLFGKILSSGR